MEVILKYFPSLTDTQKSQFKQLKKIFLKWNNRINLISRKDTDNFYLHHVLHSLSISFFLDLPEKSKIIDIGTGGGFPAIPLSILYPESYFTMLDSKNKKLKASREICNELEIKNVDFSVSRSEEHQGNYDFITGRAVSSLKDFYKNTKHLISDSDLKYKGIYYLKGGDITQELKEFNKYKVYNISDHIPEVFFETKKLIYLPF